MAAPLSQSSAGSLTVRCLGPDGLPLPRAPLAYLCDLDLNPVAVLGPLNPDGSKTITGLSERPLLFCAYVEVPGYGRLNFTAANGGAGYPPNGQTLDLLLEVARHRHLRCLRLLQENGGRGFEPSNALRSQLTAARELFEAAKASVSGSTAQAGAALKALATLGPASEDLVTEIGRWKLKARGGLRPDQWVSTFALYEQREGQPWRDAMRPLFDCGVLNWQWQSILKPDDVCDWSADPFHQEKVARSLRAMGKHIRGTAGMWLNRLPPWCKNPSAAALKRMHRAYAAQLAQRFPEVDCWQIVSEATGSWDNLGFLEPEDLLSLTRAVSEATHQANPKADRGVNSVLVWGEEAPARLGQEPVTIAPYNFHRMLNDCGIPYEFIVIQLYFSGWDVFEVDQLLETFRQLGKPLHLELAAAAATTPMPACHHFPQGHPGMLYFTWRRPWDAALQAEWLARMFEVCLSKDFVREWCWWDLADYDDCYYPWSGLFDKDYRPKESYRRLEELASKWGAKGNPKTERNPNPEIRTRPQEAAWH